MANITKTWRALAAASATSALLAACNDGGGTTVPPSTPPSSSIDFTLFVNQAFSNSANSMPVAINSLTFNYDANDDPTAFDTLIAAGTF
jgi:hypothetical protein